MAKNHPKRQFAPSVRKQPEAVVRPREDKSPRSIEVASCLDLFPAWRLGRMEMLDRFGWHSLNEQKLHEIRERLASLETMTWSSILVGAKKKNHSIDIDQIIGEAQDWLSRHKLLLEKITVLHLSNREVVWGYLAENGIFVLLWWDPLHEICPSQKKHT